jgi:hypothetical protein
VEIKQAKDFMHAVTWVNLSALTLAQGHSATQNTTVHTQRYKNLVSLVFSVTIQSASAGEMYE